MIQEYQLRILPEIAVNEQKLKEYLSKEKGLNLRDITATRILKRSIDARQRTIFVNLKVRAYIREMPKDDEYEHTIYNKVEGKPQVIVVGAGPGGLFVALRLIELGLRPVVIERGKDVRERKKDLAQISREHTVDPESNYSFGEGGAGTFSDGKLNTLVKDPLGRNRFVLDTFVSFGAPEKITYESKPHIGTDILSDVIAAMREEILQLGGTFEFENCVTDIRVADQKIKAVEINHNAWMETEVCVLALGHSARDTFEMLQKTGLFMEPKAFAVGFRVEHPQRDINRSQYGEKYAELLEAAPYKVTANLANGRGVYSFCMCPGGYVVNASSEEKRLAVNGMSYSDRGSKNANSAIIVSVTPDDFDGTDALSGVEFQRRLEEKAFALGNGKIPQQLFGDYCENKKSTAYGIFSSETRGETAFANL